MYVSTVFQEVVNIASQKNIWQRIAEIFCNKVRDPDLITFSTLSSQFPL
jgi:hypothetical protein